MNHLRAEEDPPAYAVLTRYRAAPVPIAKLKDQIDRLKTPKVEPPAPDERDAVIEKLEDALAEERDSAAALQSTVDELRFQKDTLETSYATQLNDARERSAAAEGALAELQARLDELSDGEDILEVLATAKADLEQVTAERNRLRERIREPADGQRPTEVPRPTDPGAEFDAFSIDELLEDAVWAHEQARIEKDESRAAAAPVDETPPEDMVPPDLVFPRTAED